MPKLVVATSLVAVLLLVACGGGPTPSTAPGGSTPPSPSPAVSAPPSADPSSVPSVPPASPAPTATPASSKPPVATPDPTPKPSPIVLKVEETYLLAGVRADLKDCVPVREGLPKETTGAIECVTNDPNVAKVGFYLFDGSAAALDAYYARFKAEGVPLNTGTCSEGTGEGEGAYIPGPDDTDSRHGCFVNDQGVANYRATLPGLLLYMGVLGRNADTKALEQFAWRGNADVPGQPTLWVEPENY